MVTEFLSARGQQVRRHNKCMHAVNLSLFYNKITNKNRSHGENDTLVPWLTSSLPYIAPIHEKQDFGSLFPLGQ